MNESTNGVLEATQVKTTRKAHSKQSQSKKPQPKRQPRYNVILWDDSEHTFEYVELMMQDLFRMSDQQSHLIAKEVDTSGRAICLTTTREHAELKRDQIRAYGRDPFSMKSGGSMISSIEPEPAS